MMDESWVFLCGVPGFVHMDSGWVWSLLDRFVRNVECLGEGWVRSMKGLFSRES